MNYKQINLRGELIDLNTPIVMGILNITPDSFYKKSRYTEQVDISERIEQVITQGAKIIDIGGYSTRPNASVVSVSEEKSRLKKALDIIVKDYRQDIFISIDTFRSEIAEWAVEYYGVDIINDISAGDIDKKMFNTISKLNIPYILMHINGDPSNMMNNTNYPNGITIDILDFFIKKIGILSELGVSDIIIDLGFGFSKTLEQNYELMANIKYFQDILNKPMLVGISRKSMIYKLNNSTPEESLNGTSILNTYSILNGANILRVHDVKEAVEVCNMISLIRDKEIIEQSDHKQILNK